MINHGSKVRSVFMRTSVGTGATLGLAATIEGVTSRASTLSKRRARRAASAGAILLVTLLTGCTGASSQSPSAAEPPALAPGPAAPLGEGLDYVALGDSYSAGPLVGTVRADPTVCGRSTTNYPAYLAEWLQVASYRDVSCSGAQTRDVRRPQRSFDQVVLPAQADALSADTDLVTIGLGGNDFGIFGALSGCAADQQAGQQAQDECRSLFADPVAASEFVDKAKKVEGRLTRSLRVIAERAPDAQVVVVGYPRLMPASGTCPAAVLTPEGVSFANRVARTLNASLKGAAQKSGATFVDLTGPSTGHDVCAKSEAWINGPEVKMGEAAPFHPFLNGMRGAATAVFENLTGDTPPAGDSSAQARPDPRSVIRNTSS